MIWRVDDKPFGQAPKLAGLSADVPAIASRVKLIVAPIGHAFDGVTTIDPSSSLLLKKTQSRFFFGLGEAVFFSVGGADFWPDSLWGPCLSGHEAGLGVRFEAGVGLGTIFICWRLFKKTPANVCLRPSVQCCRALSQVPTRRLAPR